MKVLVVGSGAREHAIAWRLLQSESVTGVVLAPGNPGAVHGLGCEFSTQPVSPEMVRSVGADLVIFGSGAPLVAGMADVLRAAGILVVGAPASAAIIGGSKSAAREIMVRYGIPAPNYRSCTTVEDAIAAANSFELPVAVKADGLAAGTGVTICSTRDAAEIAIDGALRQRRFGAAGDRVVVEQCLRGTGVSLTVLIDESGYLLLPTARDFERIGEGGVGPNTIGMGAIAPNPAVTPELAEIIENTIVRPSVQALQELLGPGEGYRGVLYFGLLLTDRGPMVVDYKVRFGDPEAQTILPLIAGDFGVLLDGLARGRVTEAAGEAGFKIRAGAACSIAATAAGYPGPVTPGGFISDQGADSESVQVFYAAVDVEAAQGGSMVTAGGRVLTVAATGEDLEEARTRAYERMLQINFEGKFFRRDIGGTPVLSHVIEESHLLLPQFEKRGGLLPVIVQDAADNQVLMLAYTNQQALNQTLKSGLATFWSTSRNTLWTKGETSGDTLTIVDVRVDCDQDALLYRVRRDGSGVCHTKTDAGEHRRRCFYRSLGKDRRLRYDP